ncbi:hypothetical protein [Clostridium perfringens]|uniref:Type IV pilus assembly protein PilO n=1 Tax=Clostridium perfringens (strain SM101 / Type A) TaxID=289380 RepID=Q0SQR4_CLOPS|nr:hypothetical protein [Clostridium perfringens]ABG86528.1 hypothetical protein CPR_2267 [Clostridium perfringens SM101]EJT5924149.1 hypothetical protein [Clostridium perfringens]MBP2862170.1 hypothetical protein [Clostridium perfringens]MDH5060819.1 hypothetical protein [Clostridium perfringens NCTC 8239]UBK60425.1 hypothetical protein KLF23_11650 [Clostridium perfringens]
MKINKREKTLLFVLALGVVGFGYYKVVWDYQYNKLKDLKSKELKVKQEYNDDVKMVNSIEPNKEEINIFNSEIQNLTSGFYSNISQPNIILELNNLMNDTNVKGTMSFSEIKTMPVMDKQEGDSSSKNENDENKNQIQGIVNDYNNITDKKKNEDKKNKKQEEIYNLNQMTVSLSVNGTYDNVMKFIKSIEENPKHINILNFNLSAQTDGNVSANMNIQLVAIPKIDASKEEFTTADEKYGKENPFSGASVVGTGTIENELENSKVKNDFLMTVRPINSDFPTIVLGKSGDKDKKTYLNNDENLVSNIEMYISGDNGKYYYKYKVEGKSYPTKFEGNGEEFKPNGNDINFEIFSEKRVNKDDKSGANIKIVNSSDKEVNLIINKDDEKSPRVNVTTDGKVKVIKN